MSGFGIFGIIMLAIIVLLILVGLAVGIRSLPDLQRYLRVKKM